MSAAVEPVLFIVALTALHLGVMAALDLLAGARPWPGKLGWLLVIVLLPLLGAIIYYRRAGKGAKRSRPRAQPFASPAPDEAAREQGDPALRRGSGRE